MKDAGPLLGLAIPPLLAKSIFESFRGEVMEIKSDLKTLQVPAARTKINRMPLEIEEGGEVLVKEEDEKGFSPQSPSLRLPTLTTLLPSCESLPSLPHQCLGYSVACAIQPVLTSKVSTVGYATMEGEESKPAAVVPTKLVVGLHQVEIRLLVPHPCNASIYGEDEDVSSLVESIRISGWIKPLIVTPSYIIISGHRRWQAVLVLGLETVPVEVREFSSSATELEALLLENESRHKTIEQKVREANAWRDIESELARMRKLATLKQGEH
jgi:hypothetical protein